VRVIRNWVSDVALFLSAAALLAACGVREDHPASTGHPAADAARPMSCQQFESSSGQVVVGNPQPVATALIPVPPGQELPELVRPTLDSVSIARSAGGDTVVFDLGGNGSLGWTVRFVQVPLQRGTDTTVPISGTCILQIDLTGVESSDAREVRNSPLRISPEGEISAVVEVPKYPSVDTVAQSFVGIRSNSPQVDVETSIGAARISVQISP
jgi:hypothetical protein